MYVLLYSVCTRFEMFLGPCLYSNVFHRPFHFGKKPIGGVFNFSLYPCVQTAICLFALQFISAKYL